MSILKPDGSALVGLTGVGSAALFIGTVTLPVAGQYKIFMNPTSYATGSMTLTLYDVPADVTSTITPGGSPVTVTTTVPGQSARLTFDGTINQKVSLVSSGVTIASSTVNINKPDGTSLAYTNVYGGYQGYIDTKTLPVTGTYTIVVDPSGANTGSMTLTLHDVVGITGTIVPGGAPVTVTNNMPGQDAVLTFEGTANRRISLRVGSVSNPGVPGGTPVGQVTVLKPGGTNLMAPAYIYYSGGLFIDPTSLPDTGTYTILINIFSSYIGSRTVTLYDVEDVNAGTITPGGAAVGATISVPGQRASLTFTGAASQQITVRASSNTMVSVTVKLMKPDGTTLTTMTSSSASFNLATQTLPVAGTYTVSIDPYSSNTGSMTVTLTSP